MSTTPKEVWDELFLETHGGTGKATWESDNTISQEDELEIDDYGT